MKNVFLLSVLICGVVITACGGKVNSNNSFQGGSHMVATISGLDSITRYENPAILNLVTFDVQNFAGEKDPYLVAIVKNDGKTSVLNFSINASFVNQDNQLIQLSVPATIKQLWLPPNLAIRAGLEQIIPIAPISQFGTTQIVSILSPCKGEHQRRLEEDTGCKDFKYKINVPKNLKVVTKTLNIKLAYQSIFDDTINKNESYQITVTVK